MRSLPFGKAAAHNFNKIKIPTDPCMGPRFKKTQPYSLRRHQHLLEIQQDQQFPITQLADALDVLGIDATAA